MLQLFYAPGNASFTPHMLLEELGAPYQLRLVDRAAGEQRSAQFLALNPNGLIPVLVDGDLVVYETAAICLHLVDRFPQAGLAPAVGSPERAHFYKWMVWLTNTLQATLITYFHPEHFTAADDTATQATIKAHAEARIGRMLDQLDTEVHRRGNAWLLGQRFSAVDPFAFMLGRWTRNFARPARSLPHFGPYLERVLARPAIRRTIEQEGLQAPLI
jgi:glutathione S-transferase